MLMAMDDHENTVEGKVKWFDPVKGYGFVIADSGGPDILLHANVLRAFGQNTVADGSRVTIEVQRTERGQQAVEVRAVTPPKPMDMASLADFSGLDPDALSDVPLQPARVKWFDKAKGFGFANVFGESLDVFIHIEVLRQSGLADLQPGEAISIRVIDGRRGPMAGRVESWDAAVPGDEADQGA